MLVENSHRTTRVPALAANKVAVAGPGDAVLPARAVGVRYVGATVGPERVVVPIVGTRRAGRAAAREQLARAADRSGQRLRGKSRAENERREGDHGAGPCENVKGAMCGQTPRVANAAAAIVLYAQTRPS